MPKCTIASARLLILMAVGPLVLAWGWHEYRAYRLRDLHAPMSSDLTELKLPVVEWTGAVLIPAE